MTVAAILSDSYSTFPFSTSRGSSSAASAVAKFKNAIASKRRMTGYAQLFEQPTLDRISEIQTAYSVVNWGGEYEQPIAPMSIIDALDFLDSLPVKFRSPDVVPEPAGTLALEWRYAMHRSLIVSFRGGGNISFSVLQAPNRTSFGNEQFHHGVVPSTISRLLKTLAG